MTRTSSGQPILLRDSISAHHERFSMKNIDDIAFFLGWMTVVSTMAVNTDLSPKEWVVV